AAVIGTASASIGAIRSWRQTRRGSLGLYSPRSDKTSRTPDTGALEVQLANAYLADGRLDEAIALYERNLARSERLRDPDGPDTLEARNDLAKAYRSAGRLTEAIQLAERNLADSERILGSDHLETLAARNN